MTVTFTNRFLAPPCNFSASALSSGQLYSQHALVVRVGYGHVFSQGRVLSVLWFPYLCICMHQLHRAGWFHFVGSLDRTGDLAVVEMGPGFKVSLCRKCAPELASLKGLPLVQMEIQAEGVPWVLDEAAPE